MDWIESIKEIKQANSNNRLVVFVGAGVSKNSGIMSWQELIRRFAEELKYYTCDNCQFKNRLTTCPNEDCEERYNFSQEELLKIPEYYYLKHKPEGEQGYYQFIRSCLRCDVSSNSIDEIIFQIMPHHIITTNYDKLLEKSKDINVQLYTTILQDKDMLTKSGQHYIIKMHGDIDNPENIVLKESDYINYEQNYPLVSTYIRSLLVDHTFLFVGYSLKDYNLKLIIGWINYFRKSYGASIRPNSFLLQIENTNTYEEQLLKESNINVINVKSLPDALIEKADVPLDINNQVGKLVYSYLKCAADEELFYEYVSLEDILIEKYTCLKPYRKVSHEDLIRVFSFGNVQFYGTDLHVYDEKIYISLTEIFSYITEKNKIILDTFQRAGIRKIVNICAYNDDYVKISQDGEREDKLLQMYWDNNYTKLLDLLEDATPTEKIYYYHFLQIKSEEISTLLDQESHNAIKNDFNYIDVLLHKMRSRLVTLNHFNHCEVQSREIERLLSTAPLKYRDATGYIEKIFHEMESNHAKMSKILQNQETKYEYHNRTLYWEDCFAQIKKLQSFAYDYYFFSLKNYLPMTSFSDPKVYLSYYLRAILCSYSPINNSSDDLLDEYRECLDFYPLDEIDVDMLIKYTKPEELSEWIRKYRVKKVVLNSEINIIDKFTNFCKSLTQFSVRAFKNHLHSFIILLGFLSFEEYEAKKLSAAILNLLKNIQKDEPNVLYEIYPAINLFTKAIISKVGSNEKTELAEILLTSTAYDMIALEYPHKLASIIADLAPFVSKSTIVSLQMSIDKINDDSRKCRRIFELRKLLPMQEYSDYLSKQINNLQTNQLFQFVVEKTIIYSDAVLDKYLSIISEEAKKRTLYPNERSSPDQLSGAINQCIILKLVGCPINIFALEPYISYSDYLGFLLRPEEFDYSKVDTSDYMWVNFFRHTEYAKVFRNHKKEILSDELRELFSLGLEDTDQQKIVYGILLNEDELWKYTK